MKSKAQTLVLTGSGLWCATILLAPILDLHFAYEFFSRICHQDPHRSLSLAGTYLPVCIRCTSIYFGFFLAGILSIKPSLKGLRLALAGVLVEFLVARAVVDSAWLRAMTGLALGAAVAPFVVIGMEQMMESWTRQMRRAS